MELWLWALIGILAMLNLALFVKIRILQYAAKELAETFVDRLITETNTLLDLSCRDRAMRHLANTINIQLRKLRSQRHRFEQGDRELKNAVTNISHDLRTPLTAICGYLDLLEQEEKSETAKRYIEIIQNRAELLTNLTEELFRYSLLLSREHQVNTEPVILNRVLEESIAAFYTALHERHITPIIQLPNKNVTRMLDRSSLTRVFSNLLNNAIKYSDGDLEITLSNTGEIMFANQASAMNAVQVGRLFDRFYTVETARNSTGLGLAITKTLIEQMNGTITATYENQRLCICIFFPVH